MWALGFLGSGSCSLPILSAGLALLESAGGQPAQQGLLGAKTALPPPSAWSSPEAETWTLDGRRWECFGKSPGNLLYLLGDSEALGHMLLCCCFSDWPDAHW